MVRRHGMAMSSSAPGRSGSIPIERGEGRLPDPVVGQGDEHVGVTILEDLAQSGQKHVRMVELGSSLPGPREGIVELGRHLGGVAFEHGDPVAGPGQGKGRGQTAGASADHDDVHSGPGMGIRAPAPREPVMKWRDWSCGAGAYAVSSTILAWKATCSELGCTVCRAMSLVMSPDTLIWPDMKACMAAWGLLSTNICFATS